MLVEFKIDNKSYKIECPVEDQDKVESLAKIIDTKAKKLRSHLKNADEKTLLAILCLTIQDEVGKTPKTENEAEDINVNDLEEQINREAIENINQATKKIEDLAKKIERC